MLTNIEIWPLEKLVPYVLEAKERLRKIFEIVARKSLRRLDPLVTEKKHVKHD